MNLKEWLAQDKGNRELLMNALNCTKMTVWNLENQKYELSAHQVEVIFNLTGIKPAVLNPNLNAIIKRLIYKDAFK